MPAAVAVVPDAMEPLNILSCSVANITNGTVPTAPGTYWLSSVTVISNPGDTSAMVFFLFNTCLRYLLETIQNGLLAAPFERFAYKYCHG